jgi:DNA repair protein RadC
MVFRKRGGKLTQKVADPARYHSRITDWPPAERPRERLIKYGTDSISDSELIALLIGQGSARFNAVETAKRLLNEFSNLEGLSDASLDELQRVSGVGPAKAVKLIAAFQLCKNLEKSKAENAVVRFTDPSKVADIYKPVIGNLKKEVFYVVLLSSAMKRIADFEISRGILDASLVHPREVFNPAVRHSARGIIILHNHPSGELIPSDEDIAVTNRLVESGKILEIPIFDHLIITQKGYFSFREHDYL